MSMPDRIDLMRGLPAEAQTVLEAMGERRSFRPGEWVFHQGEPALSIHLILSGRVAVERSHPELTAAVPLWECGPGDVVGEAGVLTGESRPYSGRAPVGTETLELGVAALTLTAQQYPRESSALQAALTGGQPDAVDPARTLRLLEPGRITRESRGKAGMPARRTR